MSCEIDQDGEAPDCFTETDRKARKEHLCFECGRTIQPGETYRYESGIWEGEAKSYKTCGDCLSVRDTFFCSFIYGSLWEEMEQLVCDYDGEISASKINTITPQAKGKVLELIDELIEEDESLEGGAA